MAMACMTPEEYQRAKLNDLYRQGVISRREAGELLWTINRGLKVDLGQYKNPPMPDNIPKPHASSLLLLLEDV